MLCLASNVFVTTHGVWQDADACVVVKCIASLPPPAGHPQMPHPRRGGSVRGQRPGMPLEELDGTSPLPPSAGLAPSTPRSLPMTACAASSRPARQHVTGCRYISTSLRSCMCVSQKEHIQGAHLLRQEGCLTLALKAIKSCETMKMIVVCNPPS